MNEIWKDIEGYEGLYKVSSQGQVKSLDKYVGNGYGGIKHFDEKILKPHLLRQGYYRVDLCKDGKVKHHYVHKLVADAFVKNPNSLPVINHKDENKLNNNAANLERCDMKYNINYGTARERRAQKNRIPVFQVSLDGMFDVAWDSASSAAKTLSIAHANISSCCKGRHEIIGGFNWEYCKEVI
jgi:hypothetical protein